MFEFVSEGNVYENPDLIHTLDQHEGPPGNPDCRKQRMDKEAEETITIFTQGRIPIETCKWEEYNAYEWKGRLRFEKFNLAKVKYNNGSVDIIVSCYRKPIYPNKPYSMHFEVLFFDDRDISVGSCYIGPVPYSCEARQDNHPIRPYLWPNEFDRLDHFTINGYFNDGGGWHSCLPEWPLREDGV